MQATGIEFRKQSSSPCTKGSLHALIQPTEVVICGLPPSWLLALEDLPAAQLSSFLTLRVGERDSPQMWGDVWLERETLRFRPRFPFRPGISYRIQVGLEEMAAALEAPLPEALPEVFESELELVDDNPRVATELLAIYPSASRLPANLLKFYLHFSRPMARGEASKYLRLEDEMGREVEGALLPLDPELWGPDRRRLTVLFDPGRIKRGVGPNRASGLPLIPGQSYRLTIDREWEDAGGGALAQGRIHEFQAGSPDRRPPNPEEWSISHPAAGSRQVLRVSFEEPLDQALALRLLWVEDASGARVEGEVGLTSAESVWFLRPARAWRAGSYDLVAGGWLEDLAGNSLASVFDRDLSQDPKESREHDSPFRLRFEIR